MPERDDLPGPIIFTPEEEESLTETEAFEEEGDFSAEEAAEAPLATGGSVEYLCWSSPSRVHDPKSARWFLGVFFIGLIAIITLAILREIWLALFVAASVFVMYALARVEPLELDHRILSTGIETGERLFEWKDLNSYWLFEAKGVAVLRLDTKLYLPHIVELLLPEQTPDDDIEELDELLMEYLPKMEHPHSEVGNMADAAILSVADKVPGGGRLSRWIGSNLGIK